MRAPILSTPERIAEIEQEMVYLRHIMESARDAEVKNLAAELMGKLRERLVELRRAG